MVSEELMVRYNKGATHAPSFIFQVMVNSMLKKVRSKVLRGSAFSVMLSLIIAFAFILPASADNTGSTPSLPLLLEGSVKQDGTALPAGSEIRVELDGQIRGSTVIGANGEYGDQPGAKLVVSCDPKDYADLKFFVNGLESGISVPELASSSPGDSMHLDISVSSTGFGTATISKGKVPSSGTSPSHSEGAMDDISLDRGSPIPPVSPEQGTAAVPGDKDKIKDKQNSLPSSGGSAASSSGARATQAVISPDNIDDDKVIDVADVVPKSMTEDPDVITLLPGNAIGTKERTSFPVLAVVVLAGIIGLVAILRFGGRK